MTVAVYEPRQVQSSVRREDVDMRFTRDRGPGGQHKNKTESCVVLTHRPTGIAVKVDGRDQHSNRRQAFEELERRVQGQAVTRAHRELSALVAGQVGSGQRGDKVRTYREQDGRATDHRNGMSMELRNLRSGALPSLWGDAVLA